MLADDGTDIQSGVLFTGVQRPEIWLCELIDFIVKQLPIWRDCLERPLVTSETVLTSRLCSHLNKASRKAPGWDVLQFRVEEPDEIKAARKIDLVPAPIIDEIWIEGRKYADFNALLPIECKRFPIPKSTRRDKREYLHVKRGSTGGMQRFKSGHHGGAHNLAAMIGYVQAGSIASWIRRIDLWIEVLARVGITGWSSDDRLNVRKHDTINRIVELDSTNGRVNNLPPITIRHMWIDME